MLVKGALIHGEQTVRGLWRCIRVIGVLDELEGVNVINVFTYEYEFFVRTSFFWLCFGSVEKLVRKLGSTVNVD